MNDHTSMPESLRTNFGARSACLAASRPSKRFGGSTTWSSTLTRTRSSTRTAVLLLALARNLTTVSPYRRRRGRESDAPNRFRPPTIGGAAWDGRRGVSDALRRYLEDEPSRRSSSNWAWFDTPDFRKIE